MNRVSVFIVYNYIYIYRLINGKSVKYQTSQKADFAKCKLKKYILPICVVEWLSLSANERNSLPNCFGEVSAGPLSSLLLRGLLHLQTNMETWVPSLKDPGDID